MNENHIANDSLSKENIETESNQVAIVEGKKQGKRIFFVALGLMVSFGFVTFLFLFFGKNSKTLFLYAINQEYADFISKQYHLFNNTVSEEAKNSTMKTQGNLSIKVSSNDKNLKDFENYSLDYTAFHDYKNQNLFYWLQTFYDEKTIMDVRTYGTENVLYLELKNLFSKYISVEIKRYENIFDSSAVKKDDIDYLIQSTKNLILESLHEEDFTRTRDKVSLENKTSSALKIGYVLSEKNFKEIYEFVLNGFLKDDKFLEIISKYTDMEMSEIKNRLELEKNNIPNNNYLNGKTFNFSVYFKSLFNEPMKYEIIGDNEKLEYFPKENEKAVIVSIDNVQKLHLSIRDKEILYSIHDEINVDGSLKVTSKKIELIFNETNNNIKGKFMILNQGKYKGKINLKIKNQENSIVIDGDYKNTIGEVMKLPNNLKNNSIPYTKITEEHYNEIMNNIHNNEKLDKIMKNFLMFFVH